ncbi:hypothetical protein FI667_g12457, partial [Globisporangium splendens]
MVEKHPAVKFPESSAPQDAVSRQEFVDAMQAFSQQMRSMATEINMLGNTVKSAFNEHRGLIEDTNERVRQLGSAVDDTNERVRQLGSAVDDTNERVRQLGSAVDDTNERVRQLGSAVDSAFNEHRGFIEDTNQRVRQLDNAMQISFEEHQQHAGAIQLAHAQAAAELWNKRAADVHLRQVKRNPNAVFRLRRFKKANPEMERFLLGAEDQSMIPEVNVGELVPTDFFPTDLAQLRRWTEEQISLLGTILNEDFGIQDNDDLDAQRELVCAYLLGYKYLTE